MTYALLLEVTPKTGKRKINMRMSVLFVNMTADVMSELKRHLTPLEFHAKKAQSIFISLYLSLKTTTAQDKITAPETITAALRHGTAILTQLLTTAITILATFPFNLLSWINENVLEHIDGEIVLYKKFF